MDLEIATTYGCSAIPLWPLQSVSPKQVCALGRIASIGRPISRLMVHVTVSNCRSSSAIRTHGATLAAFNALTHAVQDAWITFIRDGTPGHAAIIPAPDGTSRGVTFTEHTPSISDLGRR
jgi:hypothetical protein